MKTRRRIVRTTVMLAVFIILRQLDILRFDHNEYLILVVLFLSSYYLISKVERSTDKNHAIGKMNFQNLDIMRYICAIFIVIVHIRPFLTTSSQLDLAFNNIVGRICVPFFFVVTGYFASRKEDKHPDYIRYYIKSMIPIYITWSILYIPVIITEYHTMITQEILPWFWQLPIYVVPFALLAGFLIALIAGLLYFGIYYHLWYFPAILFSLFVLDKWKKRFSIRTLLIISFVLLLFGATETYYGTLPLQIQNLLKYYYGLFFTTRNFIFFGLFYVTLGYYMGKKKEFYVRHCFLKFSLCVLLLIGETIILQMYERLDSNILLSCIPLVYYLFISLIYSDTITTLHWKHSFRDLNKYYYLIHPVCILLVNEWISFFPSWEEMNAHGFVKTGVVLLITHWMTNFILYVKDRYHIKPFFEKRFLKEK